MSIPERNLIFRQAAALPAGEQLQVAAALATDPRPDYRELAPAVTRMALTNLESNKNTRQEACIR